MPNMAAITKVRNFWPTWMLKNLYAASVPANAAKVPSTAWTTMPPSPVGRELASKSLLSAPSATPSSDRERQHQRPG